MGLSTSSYLPDEKKFNEFTPKKNTSKTQEGGTHQGIYFKLWIINYSLQNITCSIYVSFV